MMLSNKYGGIYIRNKTDNSSQTLVTLSGYKPGYALVMLVNNRPPSQHSMATRAIGSIST